MTRSRHCHLWYVDFAIVVLQHPFGEAQRIEEIPYSQFERLLDESVVAKIVVTERRIIGEYRTPHDGKTRFTTARIDLRKVARTEPLICVKG
jgi:cell division protease FtsH